MKGKCFNIFRVFQEFALANGHGTHMAESKKRRKTVMIDSIQGEFVLRGGVKMPGYGYGCYRAEGEKLYAALLCALATGYRLVDTAHFYNNEDIVGRALKKAAIGREKIFVVSKIWPAQFDNPVKALDGSLSALGLDYLDGYLLHWPGLDEKTRFNAWEKLLREEEKGKIHALGVSNFLEHHLEGLHHQFHHWPVLNQIEIHPAFQEFGLCNFCHKREITVMGWSPLGRGNVLNNETLQRIGQAHSKSPAQVALRWQVQMNYIPLPKSVHDARVRENAEVFDFSLSDEEMSAIHALNLPDDKGKIGKSPDEYPVV